MATSHLYVAYYIAPARRANTILFSNQIVNTQEKRVQEFIKEQPERKLFRIFIEAVDNQRQRHRWPELEAAITCCLENRANLVIAELRNLTHNEAFARQILRLLGEKRLKMDVPASEFIGEIHCCDQPLIKNDNFSVLVEHARQQRQIHGQLIKAGLSRTNAKSGNPHAFEVISKVNKPKIDSAIVFALMLQPVISEYRLRGYSQRKMVSTLNEEGFTAPEGGHWVLSQLQKVLDRIKMNEIALNLEKQLLEYTARQLDNEQIASQLDKLDVPSPRGKNWTAEGVEKVKERIKQLHDIMRFNEFVIELMPILEKYHIDELTEERFTVELQNAGINLPPAPPVHLATTNRPHEDSQL